MNNTKNSDNQAILSAKKLIKEAFAEIQDKKYAQAQKIIFDAQKIFIQEKSDENTSICLSLLGLSEYFLDNNNYMKALTLINDGKYLADFTKDISAQLVNELCIGHVNFSEKNNSVALMHYKNAKCFALETDEYSLLSSINTRIEQANNGFNFALPQKRDPLIALVKIGQAVAAETSIDTLLTVIAEETKLAIQADRCTVFLYDKEHNELWSKVALGLGSQEIRFPADKGLAGHVVKTGETINITDAYNDSRFNKEIDIQTGYRTKTILCMPIKNLNQEIIGAFQVLNKLSGEFSDEDENLLVAIGSSAGISLENAQLFENQAQMYKEQKQVFDSFIDTLAASIDARDKITAGHSSRVKMYSSLIAKEFGMDEKSVEVIEKAATLHDIGKIGIRDSVLQKEGKLTDDEYKHIQEHVAITHNILEKIHMSDEFKTVTEIACSHHEKYNGSGYYRKLAGEDIPFGGRILAVSDVFDAITSKRHYRDKMPITNVINIIIKDSGSHFDKVVADKFLSITTEKIVKVFLTENHSELKEEDKEIFEKYCLMDLFNISQKETPTEDEKNFVELFNSYYMHHTEQNEENPE